MILLLTLLGCPPKGVGPEVAASASALAEAEPEARKVLEESASDLDISVRRRALASLIAAEPAPAGGPWLSRARFDPSEYVRRAAVDALVERSPEAESRAALRVWVADAELDPWTRGAAAVALARWPESAASDREGISAAAAAVTGNRAAALLLAAAMGGDAAAQARLEKILASGQISSELWFLRALGASGVHLGPIATDQVEPEILALVVVALYELQPATRPAVLTLLAQDEDTALEVLEALSTSTVSADDPVFSAPCAGVGALVSPVVRFARGGRDLAAVLSALDSDDVDLRAFAAAAAAARLRAEPEVSGADRLRAALRSHLPDAGPTLQLAILPGLARSTAPNDRAVVRALLGDEGPLIRVTAAAALTAR